MRILAIADTISPTLEAAEFPANLPPFDLVVSAGDMPGHVLDRITLHVDTPPVFVIGNHGEDYLRDPHSGERAPVGGCVDAHARVIEHAGLVIAGIEGCLRYRPGPHQYSALEMEWFALRLVPRLLRHRLQGRRLDLLLTHAAPRGPHAGADRPHHGVAAFNRLHRWWRPRVHVHGHVHMYGPETRREYVTAEGVRVVNAYGMTMIEL